jgi:osmotically-inducible protein OsmY
LVLLTNRAIGALTTLRGALTRQHVSDDVLVERVRSRLGHVSPHVGELEVTARQGVVTLSGSMPRVEREPLVLATAGVAGVKEVIEELGE